MKFKKLKNVAYKLREKNFEVGFRIIVHIYYH